MKERKRKWMKYRLVALWILVALALLAVAGSFAAYTSFNSVKRVVSTGKGSNILFGSNYLSLVNGNEYTAAPKNKFFITKPQKKC